MRPIPSRPATAALAALILAAAVPGSAADDSHVSIGPSDDAYIASSSNSGANYGSAAELLVNDGRSTSAESRFSYLKFPSDSLGGKTVKRATLRLYALSATGTAPRHIVHGIDDDSWSEIDLTWNASPNHTREAKSYAVTNSLVEGELAGKSAVSSAGSWIEIDVTGALNTQFMGGGKIVTFVLTADAGSENVSFASREAAEYRPELVAAGIGTFHPVADTFIRNGSFNSENYGTVDAFEVSHSGDGGRIAFIRFNLTSIPSLPGVDTFSSVKLRLHAKAAGPGNNSINLYRATAPWRLNWIESGPDGLTWANNAHLHDPDPSRYTIINTNHTRSARIASQRTIDTLPSYVDYNVTDFVNRGLMGGAPAFSFQIASTDPQGGETGFASKEHPVEAYRPSLLIERSTLPSGLSKLSDTIIAGDGITFAYGGYSKMTNQVVYTQEAILSTNGYQYAAFYNASRRVCVARRPIGGSAWEIAELTDYHFPSNDSHNNVSLGVCTTDGTLHLAFDHHKQTLKYRRSATNVTTAPTAIAWNASLFGPVTDQLVPGETVIDFTYPRFLTRPDGDLILRYRHNTSGDGNGRLYEYTGADGQWTKLGDYDVSAGTYTHPGTANTSTKRNSYLDGFHYFNGRLHTSWTWREDPAVPTPGSRNHDVSYAYSDDHARTWYNSAGARVATVETDPITVNKPGMVVAEVSSSRFMHNNGGLWVDGNGIVHVVALHNDAGAGPASPHSNRIYHHYWRDAGGAWNGFDMGFSGSRPKLLATNDAAYLVFATLEGGALCIAKATAAARYTDWQIVRTEFPASGRKYTDSPHVDFQRFMNSRVISIFSQEAPDFPGEPTPIHVIEFQID